MKDFLQDEAGISAIEYALLVILVGIGVLGALQLTSEGVTELYQAIVAGFGGGGEGTG